MEDAIAKLVIFRPGQAYVHAITPFVRSLGLAVAVVSTSNSLGLIVEGAVKPARNALCKIPCVLFTATNNLFIFPTVSASIPTNSAPTVWI